MRAQSYFTSEDSDQDLSSKEIYIIFFKAKLKYGSSSIVVLNIRENVQPSESVLDPSSRHGTYMSSVVRDPDPNDLGLPDLDPLV
jgi:hypothetical protein